MTASTSHALDELAGDQVRLRGLRTTDGPALLTMDRDSDGARRSHETNLPRTDERAEAWLQEQVTKVRTDDTGFLAVARIDDDRLVGTVSVSRASPRHGRFSYGIAIASDDRRRGYGFEAVTLLLRFYFDELRYRKCDTSVYAFNEPSLRMHEKLGFQIEGRIRDAVFTRGAYHDEIIVGITADEFRTH